MNEIIKSAIIQHQALKFNYDGNPRVVEPFCYGADEGGEHVLRAYQISGPSDDAPIGWKLFKVSEMKDIVTLSRKVALRSGYEPDDPEMSKVFCKLE